MSDDLGDDIDEADDNFDEMDCGRDAAGHCSMIGTEYCDWSCPYANDAVHNRSIRQRAPRAAPLLDHVKGVSK